MGSTRGTWIGAAESGNRDYFGPLVGVSVLMDEHRAARLKAMGLRGAGRLSRSAVRELAPLVRDAVGPDGWRAMVLAPERYNAMHRAFAVQGKNQHWLLGWVQMRLVEDMLLAGARPRYVLAHRFAPGVHLERRRMSGALALGLEVLPLSVAGSDMGVAAAWILARDASLEWLDRASARLGLALPRGVGANVRAAAGDVLERGGRDELSRVAKLHFRLTASVLEDDIPTSGTPRGLPSQARRRP